MYVTLNEIVQDTITLLSQAGGSGTQRYSQDRIALIINNLFDQLYARQWWPDLMEWFDLPLDGATGTVVGDITSIKRFQDIRVIYFDYADVPLPKLPSNANPYNYPAGQAIYVSPQKAVADKVFKVWDATAVGRVQFHARLHPGRYVLKDTVMFDRTALALGAAWAYAEDDGTNPGATQKFQNMFDSRMQILENELKDMTFETKPGRTAYPDRWSLNA